MDRRRTITLSVKDDFSGKLKRFTQDMDQAGRATEKIGRTGSVNLRDFNQQLFYAAQNAQVVYGAFQKVFSTASEWARMGAQAERSAYALRVYAGSAEEAERWTVAIQTAMRGTVTEGEAAAQAYMLMKFGLADSAEAAGEFARMLSVVAAANPQLGGTENALSQIQLTLANMSFMRLDQLGLSVDQVKRRMEELQRAMPGLSREAAFQEAVIEGLKEQADKLGEGMANVTIEQDRLRARIRGFKEDIGREINQGFEGAATAANSLFVILEKLTQDPWHVVVNLAAQAAGITPPTSQAANDMGWTIEWFARVAATDFFEGFMTEADREQAWRNRQQELRARSGQPSYWNPISEQWQAEPYVPVAPGAQLGATVQPDIYGKYSPAELEALRAYGDMIARMDQRGVPMQRQQTWNWGAMAPTFNFMERQRRAGTFGLLFSEAQRQQQQEIERFQRWAAGMRPGGGIDWESTLAEMQRTAWRPTAESGGIWGRAMGLAEERAEERAEKTARSLERITEAASKLSAEAQRAGKSLDEIWGIAPTAFDSSLYQKAGEALREYGVSAEKSEEAMRYMALATGEANAQSEIFALRANAAAEALARGEFDAADFAVQMGLLAREDWSWVDRLVRIPTDARGLEQYVQLIERLASGQIRLDDITQVTNTVQEGISRFQELVFGPQQEEDPLQPLKDSYDSLTAHAEQRWQNMESYMTAWVDLSTLQVRGWKESFVREIVDVETRLNTMTSRPWSVTITSSFTEGSAGTTTSSGRTLGGRAIPEFQRGGYTGDGPPGQIAGVVHRGEYVLSQDMLRKMRQGQRAPDFPRMGPMIGGGGGGVTITGPIHVHGVQNAAQLLGELKREAARKNTRLVEAMS